MRFPAAAVRAAIFIAFCGASSHGLTVHTENGPITGHLSPDTDSAIIEYLGIPYAEPPVDNLRFAPPAKYSGKGAYDASNWGYTCPATGSPPVNFPGYTPQASRVLKYFTSGAPNPQSEDCLTLNIWVKQRSRRYEQPKPVIIFLYGGRFSAGATDSPFYNGKYFAQSEDVIVVTVNYRTNIFGFPGAPGETQNAGLRDQRMAVEWIRDNISAFGGDPGKIILMGQSAGGVSADYYSYAYAKDPIISGLISHSGNALSFGLNSAKLTMKNWYNISGQLGCGTSGNTIDCVRGKNWTDVEAAAAKIPASSTSNPVRSVPGFYPSVDNETVFLDYVSMSNNAKFAKLPYLLGNNNNEQGFYNIAAYGKGINVTQAQGDQFLLESFTCPNMFEAHNRRAQGVPVWQYRYFGDWDNIRLYNGSGAYHGSDLEMIFGNSAEVSGISPSDAERRTTKLMQFYWATFARDPHHGLTAVGWPRYKAKRKTLNRLAYNNDPLPSLVLPEEYDSPCETIILGGTEIAT